MYDGFHYGAWAGHFFLLDMDFYVLQHVAYFRRKPEAHLLNKLSWLLSEYGDFLGFNALLTIGLYVAGRMQKSRLMRVLALASFLGTCFSGGTANILRATLGRARPNSKHSMDFMVPHFRPVSILVQAGTLPQLLAVASQC